MNEFLNLFEKQKPIIGMLHLGRKSTHEEALNLTKYEIDSYLENGINGVIVEDYFGDLKDVQQTLKYLHQLRALEKRRGKRTELSLNGKIWLN
jgi:hypothetical protein